MPPPAPRPLVLQPDNFTPPTRTPWGGQRIREHYKADLKLDGNASSLVGESWEVSVEPSFPSLVAGTTLALSEAIANAPVAWLGEKIAKRHGGQLPLLVKLLDAADNLSVQVHPEDGDPNLEADESGKPEAWIVLEATQGAGLYLGFREGVGRKDVEHCLAQAQALNELMNFVPVGPGDAFVIAAGTPHAIGAGVTLLEPQFVAPGCRGVTYRFWDWNRRYDEAGRPVRLYDEAGRPDPRGKPRALHAARSLAITHWPGTAARGDDEPWRASETMLHSGPAARAEVIRWPWFVVERWSGSGKLELAGPGTLTAITCLEGTLEIDTSCGPLRLRQGESGVVPACAKRLELRADKLLAFATRCGD